MPATPGNRRPPSPLQPMEDSHPAPTSENGYFRDIAGAALSRRSLLLGAGVGALGFTLGGLPGGSEPAAAAKRIEEPSRGLDFTPIAPVDAKLDQFLAAAGYYWSPLIRWGDPLFSKKDGFSPNKPTVDLQSRQFGYNNDYLALLERAGSRGRSAVLVANHENTSENVMFPPVTTAEDRNDQRRMAMAAHGMTVVELRRIGAGQPWQYQVGARLNRRITASTPFSITGPASGAAQLRTKDDPTGHTVLGTLSNSSGGTTPWGTVLSGEGNINGYFRAPGKSANDARYGLVNKETARSWEKVDDRFDSRNAGYENEPNRFGWIVEVDPEAPKETPLKHTAMGRLKHEGANVIVGTTGHVAAYMGDNERFEYLYKFVSRDIFDPRGGAKARRLNKTLLTRGSLFVAKFTGNSRDSEIRGTGKLPADGLFDGTGEWVPLVIDGVSQVPGMSVEDALIYTRLAADAVGATKMDRCADVEPSPITGKVYVACTNNTDRGEPGRKEDETEPNPRNANRDGHVIELTEDNADATARTFTWNILLLCGDPAKDKTTYFAGFPPENVSPISCPDNLTFDSVGNLWIASGGAAATIGFNDGMFKVPLDGPERGRVQQFLSVPRDSETCGPVVRDLDSMVYVAVQHPGESGNWGAPTSLFPDYVPTGENGVDGQWAGPRPSVMQIWKA